MDDKLHTMKFETRTLHAEVGTFNYILPNLKDICCGLDLSARIHLVGNKDINPI